MKGANIPREMTSRTGIRLPKTLLSVLLVAVLILVMIPMVNEVSATGLHSGDYNYTVSGSVATITGYTGSGGPVTIPSTLGGATVKHIGDLAFKYDPVVDLIVPSTVTTIGNNSFYGCNAMQFVTLSTGIAYIGDYAFYLCTALEDINLPAGITHIGTEAFAYDTALGGPYTITIPSSLTTVQQGVFYKCTALSNLIINSGVTAIGFIAFDNCTSLTSVFIPTSVRTIGDSAFYYDTGLNSVIISQGALSIGNNSFAYCHGLTTVIIPPSVTTIYSHAFQYDSSLTGINIGRGVTSIGVFAFDNCTSLTSIDFLETTYPTIGASWIDSTNPGLLGHAFPWSNFPSTNISKLSMGSNLENYTHVGTLLSGYLGASNSITVPTTVDGVTITGLWTHCFYGDTWLTGIVLPSYPAFQWMNDWCMAYCTGLTSATIPDSVISMTANAYYFDIGLTSVTIGAGLTLIRANVFQYCTHLTSVTIPATIQVLYPACFYGDSGLTTLTLSSRIAVHRLCGVRGMHLTDVRGHPCDGGQRRRQRIL